MLRVTMTLQMHLHLHVTVQFASIIPFTSNHGLISKWINLKYY